MAQKKKNGYLEAKRYVENAREILSTKAGKDGEFYSDPKYVKMACKTAYSGVLVALDEVLHGKEKGKRADVIKYRTALGEKNKTMLSYFNSAYNLLHLVGGYDGELKVSVSQEGLSIAEKLIEWVGSTMGTAAQA
ncbi:DUF5618 family protein [Parasediminibacterium sp. JCM 36343]|uniref:DUF5618 family protein n=1 Tax=Parasediminibacterium sp. JCM 36343 TaxID=3374279 RepID=UPI00397C937A